MPVSGPVTPEATEEEIPPEDRKPKVFNVKDLDYMSDSTHLHPDAAAYPSHPQTPSLSPALLSSTPESGSEPHSPPSQNHPYHPSPLHTELHGVTKTPGLVAPTPGYGGQETNTLSLNYASVASVGSAAATVDSTEIPHYPAHKHVVDASFPFPNFRPLASGTNSPAPHGMTVPPISGSGAVTPMSRNVSAASVKEHQSHTPDSEKLHEKLSADGPPPAPSATRRVTSNGNKPAMLGAIGEKKSFFHKMFHHEAKDKHDKHDKHDKERALEVPQSGRGVSPARDHIESPPLTPGTPPAADSDSSRPPSRAPSMKRRNSDKRDPHAQPPADGRSTPPVGVQRKLSQRSASHGSTHGQTSDVKTVKADPTKPVALMAGQPVAVARKEDVVAASGNKFTLKDLIGMGDGSGKLARKNSERGSDRGSTRGSERDYGDNTSTASLLKKYGICDKAAIGKGATAVVRLAHKWDRREEKLYAVKEFRKRRKNETEKDYVKKLTSEFCISSTLHHINVVETVDLVQDEQHHWCEVMEYCPGGDLYAAIKKGGMSSAEVECSFKQILLGIQYLHGMGVAHRDIKPENLLLDGRGHVKITDFGVSDVFRMCWEKKTHLSKGLCGSEPYIAPELFDHKEYDARLVDVWAAAVVFYCMQFQELPWRVAKSSDPTYIAYQQAYQPKQPLAEGQHHPTPPPLNNLVPRECRQVIKRMLDPDPKSRWSVDEALKDKWLSSVEVCVEGQVNGHSHSSAGMEIIKL